MYSVVVCHTQKGILSQVFLMQNYIKTHYNSK